MKKKKIKNLLLKDIDKAKSMDARHVAVRSYAAFIEACAVEKHANKK